MNNNQSGQPEDERVKEARARDAAQEIVIESSKAAGYADSTWLDGNFKHELTNRIAAALLPVQPAASTEAELSSAPKIIDRVGGIPIVKVKDGKRR